MSKTHIQISIPRDVRFSDLGLARQCDGSVRFDESVLRRICDVSSLNFEEVRSGPEWMACGIISAWYQAARAAGEPMGLLPEQIAAESHAVGMFGLANVQPAPHRLQ